MGASSILAILLTIAAAFSYINHRFIRIPMTIGLMALSLFASIVIMVLDYLGMNIKTHAVVLLGSIDFNETLMQGMLSYLLFAGALHVDLQALKKQRLPVLVLATFGVATSTLIIGSGVYALCSALGLDLPLIYAMLFGALISPTDPVAVMGILKSVKASPALESKIAGESLFNDGIGVVVFLFIFGIATGSIEGSLLTISSLFFIEVVCGILLGLAFGYLSFRLLKSVDDYKVEILITLALVSGTYALANSLHMSGPLAVVVAGLLIGNTGREFAMSNLTVERLDVFWELIDEILNAVLFVLIGLEVLVLKFDPKYTWALLAVIPLTLVARFTSIAIPIEILKKWRAFSPGVIKILTWGGLRGGISVALALQIPHGPHRDFILVATYAVVVFSILVQGLTFGRLVRKYSEDQ